MSNHNYTTDFNGRIAYPNNRYPGSRLGGNPLPVILGEGKVREMAREVADSIISDARTVHGPVVWITSNRYMPPIRDIPLAEEVWNAENNRDGELFAWFVELVEDHLSAASVALECPDYDNALYAVDLNRWQYREWEPGSRLEYDDLSDEWEPADPHATDDDHDNPRE